jgi:hypothetical protein
VTRTANGGEHPTGDDAWAAPPTVVKAPPASTRVPLTTSAQTDGDDPPVNDGTKVVSSAPVAASRATSRSRAMLLMVVNSPPTNTRAPETASAHTVSLAEAVKVASTVPSASSFTSRLREAPLTWVNSPPTSQPPAGSATAARTRPLTSRRGSTGVAEVAAKVAKPKTRFGDGATDSNDPPT